MKIKATNKKVLLSSLIAGVFVSSAAFAAPPPADKTIDTFSLEEIVVTAQRQSTRELDTPASVDVVTARDIEKTGAKTVFDALSFIPGIVNFSYGPGGADYGAMDSRVNIRGFERGALILVNGAPINLNGKNSLDGIMTENVERIEVVKGASSVLYGSEAMGGVINIITKKGADGQRTAVSVTGGNRGYDRETFSHQNENFNVSYTKQHFGAQKRTSPDRADRGYYNNRGKGNKENYAFSVDLDDSWNLSYMHSEANSMYGQTNYKKPSDSKDYRYNDKKDTVNLSYADEENRFKAIAFYNARDLVGETFDHAKPAKGFTVNSSNYKADTLGLDMQKSWTARGDKDTLLVGLLTSREEYEGTSKQNSGVNPDRTNYALYAQYSYQATPRFTSILGFREQIVDDPVKDQHVFIPQLQTNYKINDTSAWYTNIGKAFQMPSLSDSFKTVSGQYAPVSGRNLKPQEGWNYETGYKIINDHNSWKFALYHMDMKNAFAWAKDETGQDVRVNKGKFKNTGLEIEHTAILSDTTRANFGINWSNPVNQADDGGDWTLAYPKFQFSAGLDYTKEKLDMSLVCNYLTKRLKNRDGGKNPDLINLNAAIAYNATASDKFTLNLNNLLDRDNVITNGDWEYYDLPFNWTVTYTKSF